MYSTVIEIKKNITGEALRKLRQTAEDAFSNRAGSVRNSSTEPHKFVFVGGEADYGCLDLGMFALRDVKGFLGQVDSWRWIDEDPSENCDMLKIFAMPVR